MVTTPSHQARLADRAAQDRKITPAFAALRGEHLARLGPLEELARELAPLPISYDVTRLQPPFFQEFTYTEMLGGLYVAPQSCEIAARLAREAAGDLEQCAFSPADAVMSAAGDKYRLQPAAAGEQPAKVAFLPGSNIFSEAVSREALTRLMHEDPDVWIKPHPMTAPELLRQLGRSFGYHRILDPMASGWACLQAAEIAFVTTTTEMGLYAVLLGKRIVNLSAFQAEPRGVYNPFYRLLWSLEPSDRRVRLRAALASPCSGFVHPDDPDPRGRLERFFARAMAMRELMRPLVHEFDAAAWAAAAAPRPQRSEVPHAVGQS